MCKPARGKALRTDVSRGVNVLPVIGKYSGNRDSVTQRVRVTSKKAPQGSEMARTVGLVASTSKAAPIVAASSTGSSGAENLAPPDDVAASRVIEPMPLGYHGAMSRRAKLVFDHGRVVFQVTSPMRCR